MSGTLLGGLNTPSALVTYNGFNQKVVIMNNSSRGYAYDFEYDMAVRGGTLTTNQERVIRLYQIMTY